MDWNSFAWGMVFMAAFWIGWYVYGRINIEIEKAKKRGKGHE